MTLIFSSLFFRGKRFCMSILASDISPTIPAVLPGQVAKTPPSSPKPPFKYDKIAKNLSLFPPRLCGSKVCLFFLCVFVVKMFLYCNDSSSSAQIAQRRIYASYPLQLRQFSGISRTTRRTKLSIQRFLGGFPPVISADEFSSLLFSVSL